MLDCCMVKLLIIVHPVVKVPLCPCLAVSIATPVVIPMATFEITYAWIISCFLSSGWVVVMAYSSVFCGKRLTNGVVFPKNSSP